MESNFVQATCDYSTACKLLDCGESTVRRLCQQGELTCIRHGRKMRTRSGCMIERRPKLQASANH